MSGPEPPPTDARLHGWLLHYLPLTLYKITFSNVTRGAVPRRLRSYEAEQNSYKSTITMQHILRNRLCPIQTKRSANAYYGQTPKSSFTNHTKKT